MSQIESTSVFQSYFKALLNQIKANETITFDIYIYFEKNGHLVILRRNGELISNEILDQYIQRGIHEIWIHKSHQEAFDLYLNPNLPDNTAELSQQLIQQIYDDSIDDQKKKAITAVTARSLLKNTFSQSNIQRQNQIHTSAVHVIQGVVRNISSDSASFLCEIWDSQDSFPRSGHSNRVATYTALFALCMGKIELDLISDLAMTGFLLDEPSDKLPESRKTPNRVKILLRLHHQVSDRNLGLAKTDSQDLDLNSMGYDPQEISDLQGHTTLLALAKNLDSIASGKWDGTQRTYKDALNTIENDKNSIPNREAIPSRLISAIKKWTQN